MLLLKSSVRSWSCGVSSWTTGSGLRVVVVAAVVGAAVVGAAVGNTSQTPGFMLGGAREYFAFAPVSQPSARTLQQRYPPSTNTASPSLRPRVVQIVASALD